MNKELNSGDLTRQLKSGITLVLLCIVMIFALQNSDSVTVVFMFWQMTLPRVLIFFVFFTVGFLCGLAVTNWRKLTRKQR